MAIGGKIEVVANDTTLSNINEIGEFTTNGVYCIGFDDSHVGFLLKEKGNLYLIHSNFINYQGVIIEPIEDSDAFNSYFKFYIVPLSGNKKLMNYWVNDRKVRVITN